MRKLCLLAALISPLASAQVVSVEPNSLMRLPNTASTLQLERLEVADYGTLLIPSNVTEVTVGELHLGREARIAIVPGEQALALKVRRADLSEGSQITSRGAPGTYQKAAPIPLMVAIDQEAPWRPVQAAPGMRAFVAIGEHARVLAQQDHRIRILGTAGVDRGSAAIRHVGDLA